MAQATTLLDRQDRAVFTIFTEQRIEVPLAQISPLLVKAIVSIEDQRFYEHQGVDTVRIAAAALTNLREGRRAQGGSTLTQQLARQAFLTLDKSVRPQAQGSDRRRRARSRVLEGRDPRAVPEQGLLRRRPARRRSGLAGVLRQARLRSHAGRSRAHRGPGEVAVRLCADGEPEARHHAARPGAADDGRQRRHHAPPRPTRPRRSRCS